MSLFMEKTFRTTLLCRMQHILWLCVCIDVGRGGRKERLGAIVFLIGIDSNKGGGLHPNSIGEHTGI